MPHVEAKVAEALTNDIDDMDSCCKSLAGSQDTAEDLAFQSQGELKKQSACRIAGLPPTPGISTGQTISREATTVKIQVIVNKILANKRRKVDENG